MFVQCHLKTAEMGFSPHVCMAGNVINVAEPVHAPIACVGFVIQVSEAV